MTAAERYWTCIEADLLPATVPIGIGQEKGLATIGCEYKYSETTRLMVQSDSRKQRAAVALLACQVLHRELGTLSGSQAASS